MLGTHFLLFLLMNLNSRNNAHTINTNASRSPNTTINPVPPSISKTVAMIASISNTTMVMINVIIVIPPLFSSHKRGCCSRVVHMFRLSKQVSHRSLGKGFIFKAHIIWRIVIVGNTPSTHSPERSINSDLNFGCKYNESVSHGSISLHQVCLVSGSNLCCITAKPLLPILNSVQLS